MIHPTAIVAGKAEIGSNVEIGPYSVVDEHVVIGNDCRIGPHCQITGHTTIGSGTRIHAGAVIGDEPQDYHYQGDVSYTRIGSNCVLREYVTVHRGAQPESTTAIGDDVMLMGFVHIAHNCLIGNRVIVANACLIAGHVEIEDAAFISGGVMMHQFIRIGTLAMAGGGARLTQDLPPYCMVGRQEVTGPNTVGLRRAGLNADTRQAIRKAIKLLYFSGLNRPNAIAAIREQFGQVPEVNHLAQFVAASKRGIVPAQTQPADE
jgi:UDP-N-acetylglucosamine acyltransferase